MLFTLVGIVMLVKLLFKNAKAPILVTLSDIVMLVNPLQPENASSPMLVTLFGIVIVAKSLQLANAELAIVFVPSFILQLVIVFFSFNQIIPYI